MAHIGDDIFIGDDWFVGAWADLAKTLNSAFPEKVGDLWVYRNADNDVITQLNFGKVLPNGGLNARLKIQYTGYSPVKVSGFYVTEVLDPFYDGDASPVVDKQTLLTWADNFTGAIVAPLRPGLEISQTDWNTGAVSVTQVKSGVGDLRYNYVPYIGHENGIITIDDEMVIDLFINAPDDVTKQILKAGRFHFGFEINFTEIPRQLHRQLVNEAC